MLRATGRVVRVESKSGSKANAETGEVREWGFDIIKLLVADQAIVEVQRFRDNETPAPAVGAQVDYAVTVDVFRNRPSFQLDQPWANAIKATSAIPTQPAPQAAPVGAR